MAIEQENHSHGTPRALGVPHNATPIHLRKGRSYPSKPPPLSTKNWEEVRREKEERILKARRERALSTPLETTSSDAMDTKEAQEISKEIVEKATERELRKLKYAQYQRTKQTADYKVPKTDPIPASHPQLNQILMCLNTKRYQDMAINGNLVCSRQGHAKIFR